MEEPKMKNEFDDFLKEFSASSETKKEIIPILLTSVDDARRVNAACCEYPYDVLFVIPGVGVLNAKSMLGLVAMTMHGENNGHGHLELEALGENDKNLAALREKLIPFIFPAK
jgi:hypothetical protein